MKRLQALLSWISVILLLTADLGLGSCGAKEASSAPAVQQEQAQQGQVQQAQAQPAQAQQMQLPEVNLTPDGLDELLAPIALYPDPVLAVMLQASVNPQEVMDGGNWLALDQNQNLKEAALDQASSKAGFTPVMQALLHYPTAVDLMCTQFDWTKQIGAAYQASPKAVLDAVQRLRAQALDNGALKSSSQMKVDVTQNDGQQVVELKPADPKVVYIPQYNPDQVFQSTTTTTTRPDGTTTTTTTTTGPTPASTSASTNTTTVVQQKEGVSTGTAVMIGLLSFGAGVALGAAINNNNYYYPSWGHGGVWYGPRPYYPPPYRPVYYGGWGPAYGYHRPVHYGNNNIYINNTNNYYNRFNNNNNLNANYKPRPVPYNKNPNSTYSRNMGGQPSARQGVNYRPATANTGNVNTRAATGNNQNRPSGANTGNNAAVQRPATGNNSQNWKGQTTYHGRNNQVNGGTTPNRNPSSDRGFAQNGGTRPTTGNLQANRPNTGNAPTTRPSTGNMSASRPATANQPSARPANANQPASRPAAGTQMPNRQPSSGGGAFGGASSAKEDRAASNRGHASMGANSGAVGGRKR